jgi:4-hydroxy-2-oxoheptanedioate aldolase
MANPPLPVALTGERPLPTGWLTLPDPLLAETMVEAGFKALVIDLQHGMLTTGDALHVIAAIKARNGYALARIPVGAYETASLLLDWGADAVVTPMIETADEARAFAAFAKYPPLGGRSWGPTRAVQLRGGSAEGYRLAANDETLALVMIETRQALANLDDILAVPGIDGAFVGPYDLSIALANGESVGVDRPDNVAAIEHVARRSRAAGKICGIYGASPAHARRYRALGYHFSNVSQDVALMADAVRAGIAALE